MKNNTRKWKHRSLKTMKIFGSSLGGAIAIGIAAFLSESTTHGFMIPPFGATCVIAFMIPNSSFAKPKSIIGGHVLASMIGISCFNLFGSIWWSYSLALAFTMAIMQITRTMHPPAAADPVLILMQGGMPWNFIISPVLSGSIVLVCIAILFNKLAEKMK